MRDTETVIDFVVREGDDCWVVWQRSYVPTLSWLQTSEIGEFADRADAECEVRDLNLRHSMGTLIAGSPGK